MATLVAGALAHAQAADLTEQPLEKLLGAEVTSATGAARQISQAPSAVSVLTAEDIRVLGLRTLGEVLDQMRGVHVSHSLDYVFLGARGLGRSLAGRVLLLVDGTPALDNLYDQIYLGHDAVLDVALIDRIEYAPGTGSAMYGSSAFTGVINIVTKRGRDIDGLQVSAGQGSWHDRTMRVTAGTRPAQGPEWLVSLTAHHDTGISSSEVGDLFHHTAGDDYSGFLKARWEGFSLLAWSAQRQVRTTLPDYGAQHTDRNQMVAVGHDATLGAGWRSSVKLESGHYEYRAQEHDESDPQQAYQLRQWDDGNWWSIDGQLAYDGLADHRIVVGARLRRDPLLREYAEVVQGASQGTYYGSEKRRSGALSAEDEWTFSSACRGIGGVRLDHRDDAPSAWSPLGALICEPATGWTNKLSIGRATRFASVYETAFGTAPPDSTTDERITTQEFVTEYHHDTLRLLGTVYRYRVGGIYRAPSAAAEADYVPTRGKGLELEAEWTWSGVHLRGSQAWQYADGTDGSRLGFSPRTVTKFQLSAPLRGDALQAGFTARRVGDFIDNGYYDVNSQQYVVQPGRVPARVLLDLTLSSRNWLPGIEARIGLHNLLAKREQALDAEYLDHPPRGREQRSAWIELTGTFR